MESLNTQILAATINQSELALKVQTFTMPGLGNGKLGSRKQEAAWDVGGGPGGLDTSGTRGEGRVCGCFGGLANPWDPHPLPGFLLPTST